jgi:hypothetical protein
MVKEITVPVCDSIDTPVVADDPPPILSEDVWDSFFCLDDSDDLELAESWKNTEDPADVALWWYKTLSVFTILFANENNRKREEFGRKKFR